ERIELTLELAPALGVVEADPHQLEQMILNLATNARDAMPNQGHLVIRTWNEGSHVGLSMKDTGIGMDSATQSRILEPLFTTNPQEQGTGLGLSTVYGMVKQSGGQISVQSEVGMGTTIFILFPAITATADKVADPGAAEAGLGSETILLVENDAAVREALAHGLEQEGYRIIEAANGFDACQHFTRSAKEVALVVTDMVMPEMGGIALGERLRDLGATIPIVYVTGYHQDLEKYPSEQLPLCGGF